MILGTKKYDVPHVRSSTLSHKRFLLLLFPESARIAETLDPTQPRQPKAVMSCLAARGIGAVIHFYSFGTVLPQRRFVTILRTDGCEQSYRDPWTLIYKVESSPQYTKLHPSLWPLSFFISWRVCNGDYCAERRNVSPAMPRTITLRLQLYRRCMACMSWEPSLRPQEKASYIWNLRQRVIKRTAAGKNVWCQPVRWWLSRQGLLALRRKGWHLDAEHLPPKVQLCQIGWYPPSRRWSRSAAGVLQSNGQENLSYALHVGGTSGPTGSIQTPARRGCALRDPKSLFVHHKKTKRKASTNLRKNITWTRMKNLHSKFKAQNRN